MSIVNLAGSEYCECVTPLFAIEFFGNEKMDSNVLCTVCKLRGSKVPASDQSDQSDTSYTNYCQITKEVLFHNKKNAIMKYQVVNESLRKTIRALIAQVNNGFLTACVDVARGYENSVEVYLSMGGNATKELTSSDILLLNNTSSSFRPGDSLLALASRFERASIKKMLLDYIENNLIWSKKVTPDLVADYISNQLQNKFRRNVYKPSGLDHDDFSTYFLTSKILSLTDAQKRVCFHTLLDLDLQEYFEVDAQIINWSKFGTQLFVLWNGLDGDGDGLLDSVMQAILGVPDQKNVLRNAFLDSFSEDESDYEFLWCTYIERQGVFDENELEEQWNTMKSLVREPGALIKQLHLQILSNVIKKPIIVYGAHYELFKSIEGIYLPLIWNSVECDRCPIALGYKNGHFSALVSMESTDRTVPVTYLPLKDASNKPLPIHFLNKHEAKQEANILKKRMEISNFDDITYGEQMLLDPSALQKNLNILWLNRFPTWWG